MASAVHDLPVTAFPFTIEMWGAGVDRRGAPSWRVTCDGPGAVQIPALGEGAWTRVTYANGGVDVVAPPGAGPADF